MVGSGPPNTSTASGPLDDVDAKLNIASKAPAEQRRKAKRMRGAKKPDLAERFFFIARFSTDFYVWRRL